MNAPILRDRLGRRFQYLRLSVTPACNFRCVYCLPQGYCKPRDAEDPLRVDEIGHLIAAFAALGFNKVRFTGGEPTVRRDIVELTRVAAAVPGIDSVALSTNGYRLDRLARPLREAGATALNVSLDSLDPDVFERITGHRRLAQALSGIEAALRLGYRAVKVNVVLLKGLNDAGIEDFLRWTRDTPVTVRFIELMQTADNRAFFLSRHLAGATLRQRLLEDGWKLAPRPADAGPAEEYEHAAHAGRIGLIAPYAKDFCQSCNRLRVSSRGGLRLCLFGERDYPLRPLLQSPQQQPLLLQSIRRLIERKPVSHLLHQGRCGNTHTLAAIGG